MTCEEIGQGEVDMLTNVAGTPALDLPHPAVQRQARHTGSFADALTVIGAAARTDRAAARSDIAFSSIEAGFDAWSRQRRRDGAEADLMQRIDDARTTYLGVARRVAEGGGLADALGFVRTLDAGELRALQQVHGLAEPVDPSALSEEGARNLLLPRTMACDLDGDGQTMICKASMIVFPPGDAPQAMKDAWAKTTEDMDFGLRLHLEMAMHGAGHVAATQDAGTGDYAALVDCAIAGAEFNRRFQRADQSAWADRLLDALNLLKANLAAA